MHDRVKAVEDRTAPPKEDKAAAEAAAAAAAGLYGVGGFMMNDTLMLANSAYGPSGYGASGGIPDPYQQQQQQMNGYGAPAYGASYGGGYGGGGGGYY